MLLLLRYVYIIQRPHSMVMVLRPKCKASLPSHHYTRVTVEPKEVDGVKGAQQYVSGRLLNSTFLLPLLRRALLIVGVFAPVVFLFVWNHLFAIDIGPVLADSGDGGSSIEKTFTVR